MTKERLGGFIAERRKSLGMTQKELAASVNVTDKAVSKWERGMSYPDVTLLEPLATALSVRIEDLMMCQISEETEEIPMLEETRNLLEVSSESFRTERRKTRGLRIVLAVLVLAAAALGVLWGQSRFVSETRLCSVYLKEQVDGKQYLYVKEYGHLLKLECGDGVDFDAVTADEKVYELAIRWNQKTYEGTVSRCAATTGVVLGSIMDTEFEAEKAAMFGHPEVYYRPEHYVPNLYAEETGIRYLCEFRCWLWDREKGEATTILLIEDCAAALAEDIDNDGMKELIVLTRWPEKPYTIYDGENGAVTESWPESVDERIDAELQGVRGDGEDGVIMVSWPERVDERIDAKLREMLY